MRTHHMRIAVSVLILTALCACVVPQSTRSVKGSTTPSENAAATREPMRALDVGEVVSEIDNSCWVIFHDASGNFWFGSDGRGVSRFDGKTITRFITMDGLAHDQIRGITEHRPTGHILISTNGGVSMFDGQRFTTLAITEMQPPRPQTFPAASNIADSFKAAGWILNDTDTWLPGGPGGPRRYDGKTLYQLKFPKSALEEAWRAKQEGDPGDPYVVWHVYTDSRGHKWFGTGGLGVCRFDGRSFDWMHEDHLTQVPGGGWFGYRSIIEDRHGAFWICNTKYRFIIEPHGAAGQEDGLLKYQRTEGMDWSAVDTTDEYIYFQSATKDNNGDLWMSPWAGGVWRHDGTKGTHYPMTVGDEEIKMISIYKDNHGDIWVASQDHGPYKFNGTAFERFAPKVQPPTPELAAHAAKRNNPDPYFTPTQARVTSTMPQVIIRNMRQDHAGNIWFASYGGPIRYDGKTFTNFGEDMGLARRRIFSLLEARNGAMWFGSITGGVSRYDGNTFTQFTTKDGLAGNDISWIFQDRDGYIWLATEGGVSKCDGNPWAKAGFTNFTTKDGLLHNAVYTIGQDATGRMWFGGEGGICSYDSKTGAFINFADTVGESFSNIRAMAIDHAGNLWFGGQSGAYRYNGTTLTTFNSRNGLLDDFVGSMIVDRAGHVWFGHPGHGVDHGGASRYDGQTFTHFTKADGLNADNVYAMLEDKDGNIWFGSVNAGACRYDGKVFTNFSAPLP